MQQRYDRVRYETNGGQQTFGGFSSTKLALSGNNDRRWRQSKHTTHAKIRAETVDFRVTCVVQVSGPPFYTNKSAEHFCRHQQTLLHHTATMGAGGSPHLYKAKRQAKNKSTI
jgi:hypothetical protein